MRSRITIFILLAVGLVFALLFARQAYLAKDLPRDRFSTKKLSVLTYSTFMGATGPGREIVQRFKHENGCDVEVQTVGDAGLLLERLRINQTNNPFDVVIGLDQFLLGKAQAQTPWRVMKSFDWSPMTFVYRRDGGIEPPHSFDQLLDARFKGQLAVEDPRASSPGLQFVEWVRTLKGRQTAEFFRRLKPNVQNVAPSWALAYGLFEKKQVALVFSYLTSLAFHWGVENDRNYQVVAFPEGHPVQTEFAGVPDGCQECRLAEDFIATLLQPWAQDLIMRKNFMLPVVKSVESGIFAELPQLKLLTNANPPSQDLSDWDQVFQH